MAAAAISLNFFRSLATSASNRKHVGDLPLDIGPCDNRASADWTSLLH
jgi:hypothetical protein